jgi:hypothetical protein
VFLLFALATALVFQTWLPHLRSALIGPPEDNMQDLWNTWYAAVAHQPGRFFHTDLLRFPEGTSLHLHAFAYPKAVAVAILARIVGADTGTLVLLQNLALLISFPLAGAGAYCLARHLTASTGGALLGGFAFAFNPSHVAHTMHHAGVSSIEFIPPFVLFYLLASDRKSPACLALAIVFYALAALSSWYYLVYLASFILLRTLYVAVCERCLPRGGQVAPAIVCPVAVVAILSPLLAPMAREAMAIAASAGNESSVYVADLAGFAAFPPTHALAPLAEGLYGRFTGNAWEATAYLGLANLTLLSWALFTGRARSNPVLAYALCGSVAFAILACGSRLNVLGHGALPLPSAALSWLPLAAIMQAPSRAIAMAYLCLCVAIAQAFQLIWRARGPFARGGLLGMTALIVADYLPVRALAMTPVACPAGLAIIRDDPEAGFGVLDLPPHGYAERNLYMLQQICHGRPIVLGNTSRRAGPTLGDRLDTWNMAAQREQLIAARVKYVVLHPSAGTWHPNDAPPAHYATTYRAVHESPALTVFRVY